MYEFWRRLERAIATVLLDVGPPAALAAFLLFVTPVAAHAMKGTRALDLEAFVLLAASALALVPWRRLPTAAYAASVACTAFYLASGYPTGPIVLAPLGGLFAVELATGARRWIPAAILGAALLPLTQGFGSRWSWGLLAFAVVWLAVAGFFVAAVRIRRTFLGEVQARVRLEELAKEEESRRKLAEERLGLAREVHDVVGHSLATISLQAGVAEHLLDNRPAEARKAVAAIRTLSKQALNELRAELTELRGDNGSAPQTAPTPDLGALAGMIASMRAAGVAVDLSVAGNEVAVPDRVARSGYRIVQECLTNVARHAGPRAHAQVKVVIKEDHLEIEVLDDGPGARSLVKEGNGLTGMRDRAEALGGRLETGNRREVGFRVWALLPWSVP